MAYKKTFWKDRIVEKPNTYRKVENTDGTITLYPITGQVIEKGTPVSAANLNKLENGIVEVYKELDNKIDGVANKGTTVAVLERVTKQEIDRQIADGTIANLTIAPGSITKEKLDPNLKFGVEDGEVTTQKVADKNITPKKTSFIETEYEYENLFNKNACVPGYLGNSGQVITHNSAKISDFIAVDSKNNYNLNITEKIFYYDKYKNFLSSVSTSNFTPPQNAKYIRFTSWGSVDSIMLVIGTMPPFYVGYGVVNKYKMKNDIYYDEERVQDIIKVTPISLKQTQYLRMIAENLFDKRSTVPGYLSNRGTTINDGSNASKISDFIEVDESTTYNVTSVYIGVCFYDAKQTFLSRVLETKFTTPAKTKYIRFDMFNDNKKINSQMCIKGEEQPLEYVYFGEPIVELVNCKLSPSSMGGATSVNILSKLKNKIWNALGDSITFGANTATQYHKYIADRVGCTVRNYGINSSTIATEFASSWACNPMCQRYKNMDDNADIVTVFGGVNDAGGGTPTTMGDINSKDTNTFYGAYNTLLEGLIKKYPNATIATFTPLKADDRGRQVESLKQIAKAVKECSAKYGIPCLDLYNMSGLSTLPEQMTLTMPDKLHPNEKGHDIISRKIQTFLESLI